MISILSTKLHIPQARPRIVPRQRLIQQLNQGLDGKLTLVSAPAGFGKTTLLSECVHGCDHKIAWLSLDEGDNDPSRFLAYFITTLGIAEPGTGEGLLHTLESTPPPDMESTLTRLVNEIAEVSQPIILVLDDYHVITESEIQKVLLFVLENLPVQMHLVVSTRSDPPWPLARFRVRGELSEIRSQDLRFTQEEAAIFLNDAMGLALSLEDVAALEARTEGWIAGLQMAAISMRGRDDKASFIQAFTGSHRFVIDYLMEEVLEQQPPEIQDFLLKTSILERLNSDLCDMIVSHQSSASSGEIPDHRSLSHGYSQTILETLEQNNLFLIPLDDQRRWYRYHHLFADLLRNHLYQTYPDEVVHLHQRASLWYGMNDLLPDAIKHALAVDDIEQVIYLTEKLAISAMNYGELRALMGWLDGLPETAFQQYPWLLVTRALGHFNSGKYELTEARFTEVESILSTRSQSDETVIRIRGHIAAIRSYLAEQRDDPLSAIQQAEDALALLPEKDIKLRSYVLIRWANGLAWLGDFQKAIQAYKEAGETSKQIGDGQSAIIALSEMAIVQMFVGNLRQATDSISNIHYYAEELALRDGRQPPAMGVLYRHMSHIKREHNELVEAIHYANEAVKICRQWGEKEALIFSLLAVARIKFAQGEYDQVEDLFQQILPIAGQISPKVVEGFRTWSLHYQLLQGKTKNAEIWARDLGLTPSDKFGYDRRYVYQNYAHLLAAKEKYPQALKVVDALVKVANNVGDRFYKIQYLVLKAIILNKLNQPDKALAAIETALKLASTEGYVRSILDEGEAVAKLLRMAIANGIEVRFASALLTALEDEQKSVTFGGIPEVNLAEPLSQREAEVLRLLVTDLTTPEIADELIVSVGTVRSHIKSIYAKLDVHSRYEAVTRAKELRIL